MKLKKLLWAIIITLPSIVTVKAVFLKYYLNAPLMNRRVPVHFNWLGMPDRWGSAKELALMFLPLLFILFSNLVINYLWLDTERDKKSFNWLSLIMTIPIGFLSVMLWLVIDFARSSTAIFHMPWTSSGAAVLILLGITALLEWRRPYLAGNWPQMEPLEKYLPQVTTQLNQANRQGKLIYWENEDPFLIRVGIILLIIFLAIVAWVFPLKGLVIIPVLLLYGGIRVQVTGERITVNLGILRIPLRRIELTNLSTVTVHQFSPLRDFGGWGIYRLGRGRILGFFWGNQGVLLTERNGRKTLVGSSHPARLAAVIQEVQKLNS